MKKLLFLLLVPVTLFSQDLKLDHSYTDSAPFSVGDTITVKFNTLSDDDKGVYFMIFDYQYNNKLLQKIDHTWKLPDNQSASKSLTHWDGYSFVPLTSYAGVAQSTSDLDFQYSQGWLNRTNVTGNADSYISSADWSVERIYIQESGTAISHQETLLEVRFRVKDRQGTNYDDYSEVTKLSWMKATDNTSTADNNLYDVGVGPSGISIDLENQGDVTGVDAGSVTIKLNSAAKADYATDFTYKIYVADGVNGKTGNAIKSGNFDANGEIITDASDLTIGQKYYLEIDVDDNAEWLDDVLTVTDVYIIFQEAIASISGNGPGGGSSSALDYSIQYLLGELNNSGNIDFDDSFQALGHVQGIDGLSEWFTNSTNGSKDVWGRVEQLGISTNDYYFGQKFVFTPTDDNKTFNFGHALVGDVDFSHGYTPTAEQSSQAQSTQARMSVSTMAMRTPIQSNIDLTSELVDGKVHFSINLQEEGVVGTQFNVKYDDSILTLDNVIFDTGNEMTNFANHREEQSRVSIGSLDQEGAISVKTGVAYKLVFTPNEEINNTSGLITFKLTEGIKADGTKVNFNIE
jgi:hypothetical protein